MQILPVLPPRAVVDLKGDEALIDQPGKYQANPVVCPDMYHRREDMPPERSKPPHKLVHPWAPAVAGDRLAYAHHRFNNKQEGGLENRLDYGGTAAVLAGELAATEGDLEVLQPEAGYREEDVLVARWVLTVPGSLESVGELSPLIMKLSVLKQRAVHLVPELINQVLSEEGLAHRAAM